MAIGWRTAIRKNLDSCLRGNERKAQVTAQAHASQSCREAFHRCAHLIGLAAIMSDATTPPRPLLPLRVGVTGHRRNKLPADAIDRLRPQIRTVFERLKQLRDRRDRERTDAAEAARSGLRIVSPLAEGADRLVASEGLAHGAELLVPLPFARQAYQRDFADEGSRAEFDQLIGRAATVIELPGGYDSEDERKASYAAVGEFVVRESDILIALWDGRDAAGYGGTAEIVASARRRERPVLWLPTTESMPPQLLLADGGITADPIGELVRRAGQMLSPAPGGRRR